MKPAKYKALVVAHSAPQEQAQLLRDRLTAATPGWSDFDVAPAGNYLGVPLGRDWAAEAWAGPLEKWSVRVSAMVPHGMPAVAAATHYRSRTLLVLLYTAGMFAAPRSLARLERDALGRLLRLPGSALPITGQHDLRLWGGPTFLDA